MNQSEFSVVVTRTIESIQNLLRVKGGEYAGSEDRLANFKRGASLTGAHPLQVLFIYLSKHYDAVATFVRDESSGVVRERSEPIEGRLDDIINYCLLAKALIQDLRERKHVAQCDAAILDRAVRSVKGDVSSGSGAVDGDRVLDRTDYPAHRVSDIPRTRDCD